MTYWRCRVSHFPLMGPQFCTPGQLPTSKTAGPGRSMPQQSPITRHTATTLHFSISVSEMTSLNLLTADEPHCSTHQKIAITAWHWTVMAIPSMPNPSMPHSGHPQSRSSSLFTSPCLCPAPCKPCHWTGPPLNWNLHKFPQIGT